MADFLEAIERVLKDEGAPSNDLQDLGGVTVFGISLRFYKTIKANASVNDVRALTKEMAIDIYRKEFWDKGKYAFISDQRLASKVFNLAVNMGIKSANICLQRAVLAATGKDLGEDGILGPQSLYAINNSSPDLMYTALKSEAASHYRILVALDAKLSKYSRGWILRAYENV